MSSTAQFRFHGGLVPLLARERRGGSFAYPCARAASLKNAIEALGVPHTEVGRVTVNGEPATLSRTVREGDAVAVHPWDKQPAPHRFLADEHLGALARYLRMMGFDALHQPGLSDRELCGIAREERRVLLSRDRELLKCRDILFGCYVRARSAEAQLQEVAARFDLAAHARPFTLCLVCNLPLDPVDKAAVADQLPEQVRAHHERFMRCHGCDRVYWPGSHYARMQAVLARIAPPAADR